MDTEMQREKLFDKILSEYSQVVANVCYMYGADSDERKDLYQECMACIWHGLKSYRGDAKLSTWLYRVCINTCVTWYRRSKKSTTVPLESLESDAEASEGSLTDDLDEMYRLISCLSRIEKAIIMMWLDEKSYDEISEVIGMPRNTVASRLFRIKAKLVKLGNS